MIGSIAKELILVAVSPAWTAPQLPAPFVVLKRSPVVLHREWLASPDPLPEHRPATGQADVDRVPVYTICTLKHATPCTCVESGWRHRINGNCKKPEIGQASVDSAPISAAICALEYATLGSGIERPYRSIASA